MTIIADILRKQRTPKNVVKEMSETFRFKGPFNKQDTKQDQTLLKSERHQLYHNFCSL